VLLGSLGLHLLAMLIFGGVKLVQYFTETETVFEVPPPAKTYEPRKLELKVKVRSRPMSRRRPTRRCSGSGYRRRRPARLARRS